MITQMTLNLLGTRSKNFQIIRVRDRDEEGIRFILIGTGKRFCAYHIVSEDGDDNWLKIVNARGGYSTTPFDNFRYSDYGDKVGPSAVWSGYQWKGCAQSNWFANSPCPTTRPDGISEQQCEHLSTPA